MKSAEHDLVVIGAGPGGYVAAIRAAQLGLNVGCVEKEAALGGTCLRIGCIPSKALLESSELFYEAKEKLREHGIRLPQVELDLAVMMGRKERIVGGLTKGIEFLFKRHRIARYAGLGHIDSPGRVVVSGETGRNRTQSAPRVDRYGKQGCRPAGDRDAERAHRYEHGGARLQ